MNFFYTSSSGSIGPIAEEDLKKLLHDGILAPDTLVIEEFGSDWKPLSSLWPTEGVFHNPNPLPELDPKPQPQSRYGANTIFTISQTGPLSIMPMPVKKVAPNAVILQDYSKMPDGSQRKVLVVGKDLIPNTPEAALKQYIPAQETRIAEIKKVLEQEISKLDQAKKLLNQRLKDIGQSAPDRNDESESDF